MRGDRKPVTPARCALRCHGLRVNRCPVGHHHPASTQHNPDKSAGNDKSDNTFSERLRGQRVSGRTPFYS